MTKQYWPIKEFSKLTGVSIRTLQFYDNHGILPAHHKNDAGYRFYSKEELLCLQKINVLKYIGFNLQQIKSILATEHFDWISSFRLQERVIQENIIKLQNGVTLINDSLAKYSATGTINWQVIAKILEVLKVTQNTQNGHYKDWVNRNFSDNEVALFADIDPVQSQQSTDALWLDLFTQAKSLMDFEISDPKVQALAQRFMASADSQYTAHTELRNKMWELMKSGDIPQGLIPGYEREIVLFMDKAIGYLFSQKNN